MNEEPVKSSVVQLVDSLLKSPGEFIAKIHDGKDGAGLASRLMVMVIVGLVLFGFVLGNFSWGAQLWWAPLKVVLGLLLSGLACLPGFFVYMALCGASISMREGGRYLLSALGVMSVLLVGFVPVLWVFSQSSESEVFFGCLVLASWLVSFVFGARFLLNVLKITGGDKKSPLGIWLGMFLLVTLQLSTTLRPLIGTPDKVFTPEKRSFVVHWGLEMFGVETDPDILPDESPVRKGPGVESENPFLEEE